MNITWNSCFVVVVVCINYFCCLVNSQPFGYPTANLSTKWTNSPSAPHSVDFNDGSTVRAILLRGALGFGPRYACGFFCNGDCDTYLFAIYIVQTNSGGGITHGGFPQVVWSANRDNPVKLNATLDLTSDGDLILRDVGGTIAWSTNTGGKSVVGLSLTEIGNLVLFDKNNNTVWESFDHPTDSLVLGQKLVLGQELAASVSVSNWCRGGLYSLSVTNQGLAAFIESNPPQPYYEATFNGNKTGKEPSYVRFLNGSLAFYILSSEPSQPDRVISVPIASSAQYMRLDNDGLLRVYEWIPTEWKEVADIFKEYFRECDYPLVCGNYGLCSRGICTCPSGESETTYFEQINNRQPALGCSERTPLSCGASENHSFMELNDTTYFTFRSDLEGIDSEKCKQACLQNCSCKAAIFRYGLNSSIGQCYLPSEIFSLEHNDKQRNHYNSTAYVKVQKVLSIVSPPSGRKKKTNWIKTILAISLGSISGLFVLIGIVVFLFWKKNNSGDIEEDYLDQVPGLPTRFSYEDLKVKTESFKTKLGEGGFGSVFEGTLTDGMKIAVKRLDGLGQIKKSFLAGVETIGSIHHVNLVRLIGFCAEKSHRLLVYEYMPNGSLDRWIFHCSDGFVLRWQQRKKIILDIAKGLTYLHQDCRQKIVHLDIKPQNILLDENFNAKVADFGLSKLVDRDQSQIVTTMRGTPGYLAPEWLSSVITEKVDTYSFGVVVLEILCGRKNVDHSRPEEDMHLLSVFKKKAEEGHLEDLIDKYNEDMQIHGEEMVNMMKVAAWCFQGDFVKRPSMSMVIKVLEGVSEIEHNLDYNFSNPPLAKVSQQEVHVCLSSTTPLLPSVLSGPR
ncbi:hypothetical protein LWI28_019875 [Acer negundo]|uniref:Receptor-like serine/threonine-protein kinase n=1 Tax=Acer negundo TaxID=4023 RepID=A0AAD5IWC0_ACENE|nr:hypothetical protein LWI28_019875 [Acer negundo]